MSASDISMSGCGMTLQIPAELEESVISNKEGYDLTTLDWKDWKYQEIAIDFENAGLKVIKVEQLNNHVQWQKYSGERKHIIVRQPQDPNFKLNEKYLYHGTKASKGTICLEGLDARLSRTGHFGKGIYFSDNPLKCVKYAESGKEESIILLQRVILGESKVYKEGEKKSKLKREPLKDHPVIGWRYFDSVMGCPKDHREYVIYNNYQALIECIITYSCVKDNSASPTQATGTSHKPTSYCYKPVGDVSAERCQTRSTKSSGLQHCATGYLKDSFGKDHSVKLDDDDDGGSTDQGNDTDQSVSDEEDGSSSSSSIETDDKPDKVEATKPQDGRSTLKSVSTFKVKTGQDVLSQIREEFKKRTGVYKDDVVDSYLSLADLDADKAVHLYEDKAKKRRELVNQSKKKPVQKEEDKSYKEELKAWEDSRKPLVNPTLDPDEWNKLSDCNKDTIIEILTENLLEIVGLENNETNRRLSQRILSHCNYEIDRAIPAYYESL